MKLRLILCTLIPAMISYHSFIHSSESLYSYKSLDSHRYDAQYFNTSTTSNQSIGIAIIAFNRPDYLARLIRSLEQNPESQFLPFFFFLDGGPQATQAQNQEIITASAIKNKTIIMRNYNYGCPKNNIDAKRFMFDWCGFQTIISMEEDLEVTPSFIGTNVKLHTWARKNFNNIGVVQCWSYCHLPKSEKARNLHKVIHDSKHWWSFVSYCLSKDVWNKISPFLYTYEGFVDQIPGSDDFNLARSKPGKSSMASTIHEWVKKVATHHSVTNDYPSHTEASIRSFIQGGFHPNQDRMTGIALWLAGYIKITTVVNRVAHIGEIGISTNQEFFNRQYKRIMLDDFSETDRTIENFTF